MSTTNRKETNSLPNRNRQGLGKKAMLLGQETLSALGHEFSSPHLREGFLEQLENTVRIKLILRKCLLPQYVYCLNLEVSVAKSFQKYRKCSAEATEHRYVQQRAGYPAVHASQAAAN